jgi:hypothetical protein
MQEYKRQPAATKDDYERALEGIEFPAAREAIMRTAHDRGGLDTEVLNVLRRLPDQDFDTLDDLLTAVRAVYADDGMNSPI